jgi:hypothetical protein
LFRDHAAYLPEWIEFLFSATGRPVSEVLVDYEQWPGVLVNWVMFGSSGHVSRPAGLVIENYLKRGPDELSVHKAAKTIVDPSRVARPATAHHFLYKDGLAVSEAKEPVEGQFTARHGSSFLRINHYWTKSEDEARAKFASWSSVGRWTPEDWEWLKRMDARYSRVPDSAIVRYVPALRQALEARGRLQV